MLFSNTKVISTVHNNGFIKNEIIAFYSLQGKDANRAERVGTHLCPTTELAGARVVQSSMHVPPGYYAVVKVPIIRLFGITRLWQALLVARAGGSGSRTGRV